LDKPFFTVVIPVYNKSPHINRSISSVLKQTFKNFEIILVDDASTDDSILKARKFKDSRLKIVKRNIPGPGGYAARNLGIQKAIGKWVAFLDADDEWMPEHLEKMFELQIIYPETYFMSSGWEFNQNGKAWNNKFYQENRGNNCKISLEMYLRKTAKSKTPVWTSVACVKKSSKVIKNIFPADNGIERGGDVFAWFKLMMEHKNLSWSNHVGAVYHRDSVNCVTKNAEGSLKIYSLYQDQLQKYSLSKSENKEFKRFLNQRLFRMWIENRRIGKGKVNMKDYLYWKNVYINAFSKYTIISIFNFIENIIIYFKKYIYPQ